MGFYRRNHQFIWKFVWSLSSSLLQDIKLKSSRNLASRWEMFKEESRTLCVLQLVRLRLCHFLPHKFYGLSHKKKRLKHDKNLYLVFPLLWRQGQNTLKIKRISSFLRQYFSKRLKFPVQTNEKES